MQPMRRVSFSTKTSGQGLCSQQVRHSQPFWAFGVGPALLTLRLQCPVTVVPAHRKLGLPSVVPVELVAPVLGM